MPFFFSCLLLLMSCVKEVPQEASEQQTGKQVTIRVAMSEDSFTKVSFTPQDAGLALAWQETDCIRVISGENYGVFTISKIISNHEAEFTGPVVAGSSFNILFPGTYASVEDAEADTVTPTQDGNGSAAHLRYKALLSGVDSYENIAFTSSWATSHGGSLKQGAAVKIQATLPDGVTTLSKVVIRLGNKDYTLPLSNVDVSASAQVLTAYMMLPWENIPIASGSSIPVYVMDSEKEVYSAALSITGDKTILCGKMNSFQNVNLAIQDFVSGNGTAESPYIIANARQLNNMHNSGVLVNDQIKYFRLMGDIDASGITNWAPLNTAGTFEKGMDFDGAGYTISGLKSSGSTYSSFAGVLYGNLYDVTFSEATINSTKKSGVVAGFIGTTANDYSRVATCTNVLVKDSEVTSTAACGGFAGHVRGKGAITGCKVINTTVNGTNHLGGFVAIADITGIDKYEVPAIFTSCEVEDVTINQNYASSSTSLYTGGFIGETYQAHTFNDCKVKGTTITATKAAVSNIGGFVGYTGYAGANFKNCEVDNTSSITAKGTNVGGFVGYATVPDAYNSCSTAANVVVEANAVGGFVGNATGAAAFKGCSATGNVTGQCYVGGFAGVAQEVSFTDCSYTSGTVTGSTTNSKAREGGFVGSAVRGISFQGCIVADASISASGAGRVGGFVGQLGEDSTGGNDITTAQCSVVNTAIAGAINSGGFVGVQYEPVSRSFVSGGSVTAGGNNCGGFSGYINNGNLTNCYTTASVAGGTYSPVGGMIGIAYATTTSYCFAAGSVAGSGSNVGAFIGQCMVFTADISACIGWNATLPFCASNDVGASLDNVYAGNEGTVSSKALAQTWPTTIWNLEGTVPVLLATPSRINAIFVGDSITWQWASNERSVAETSLKIPFNPAYMTKSGSNVLIKFHPGFFAGNGYIDKGISGQNTTQMRARFQKDVVDLNPVVAVIMGGTNDLAQGVAKEDIVANIAAMAEMARDAGIQVVLCSVTPNNDNYSKLSPKNKGGHIITLNGMIQSYASSHGFTYCNYWDSLVASDGLALKVEYSLYDNLHPGPDGYDVMEPIIKPIIDSML